LILLQGLGAQGSWLSAKSGLSHSVLTLSLEP